MVPSLSVNILQMESFGTKKMPWAFKHKGSSSKHYKVLMVTTLGEVVCLIYLLLYDSLLFNKSLTKQSHSPTIHVYVYSWKLIHSLRLRGGNNFNQHCIHGNTCPTYMFHLTTTSAIIRQHLYFLERFSQLFGKMRKLV